MCVYVCADVKHYKRLKYLHSRLCGLLFNMKLGKERKKKVFNQLSTRYNSNKSEIGN